MILIHYILKLFFHTVLPFLYIFVVSWHTVSLAFTVLPAYNVFIIVMNIFSIILFLNPYFLLHFQINNLIFYSLHYKIQFERWDNY